MSEINDFLDGKQSSEIDSFLGPDAPKPAGAIRKIADLGLSVGKGVIAVPEAAVGLANLVTGGHAGKLAESAGVRFKDAKDVLSGWQSDDFKGKQQQFQQADGIIEKTGVALSNPSLIANTVAESLPLMGAGGVGARALLGVAPRIGAATAGAIGEGIAGAGSSGEQYRQESTNGLLTGKQAALAGASGAATAAFGAAGGKLAQKLGIGDIDTMLAGGTTRVASGAAPKSAIRRMAEGAASEGLLEELPQSLSEQGFQNVALDRPVTQGMEDAGVMGVLTGGVMGAGAGAISRAAQPPTPPQATPPTNGTTPPPAAPAGPVPALGYSPLAGTPTVFPDGSVALNGEQEFARRYAPQKPSEAMGLNPAAGPLSAAAVAAVDTGAHQEIQLQQANEADQAAYEQATAEQDKQAQEQDSIDKPITSGPIAEAAMSEEDKRAILFSNKTVADGGKQYVGTQDGDILNGMGKPYPNRLAAARRANMEGKDWTIAPVFDGFVARRKDANGPSTEIQSGDTGSTGVRSTDSPASVGTGAIDGNGVGAQSRRSPDAVLDQAGELPKRVDAAPVATTRAQPTTLGKQTTATAGPGFTAKDVTRVQDPAPRADTTPAAQAVEAPAVVESNAAASEGVPNAGPASVEGDGIDADQADAPSIEDINSGKAFVDNTKSKIAEWVSKATNNGTREIDRNWERAAVKRFVEANIKPMLDGKQTGNRAGAKIAIGKSQTFSELSTAIEKFTNNTPTVTPGALSGVTSQASQPQEQPNGTTPAQAITPTPQREAQAPDAAGVDRYPASPVGSASTGYRITGGEGFSSDERIRHAEKQRDLLAIESKSLRSSAAIAPNTGSKFEVRNNRAKKADTLAKNKLLIAAWEKEIASAKAASPAPAPVAQPAASDGVAATPEAGKPAEPVAPKSLREVVERKRAEKAKPAEPPAAAPEEAPEASSSRPGEPTAEQIESVGDVVRITKSAGKEIKRTVNASTAMKTLNERAEALQMLAEKCK